MNTQTLNDLLDKLQAILWASQKAEEDGVENIVIIRMLEDSIRKIIDCPVRCEACRATANPKPVAPYSMDAKLRLCRALVFFADDMDV